MSDAELIKNTFTVEDIHNIRYKNYEKTKGMTRKEIIEHTRREAEYGLNQLKKLKEAKAK
jgi:hypothetical protein